MKAQGYCHFNDDGNNRSFRINLFETDLDIEQDPGDRALGHGAVVWDAAVVLSKFMEKTYKDYDTKTLAKKTVLELGSGCGLGGIAFMMKGAEVTFTDLEPVTKRLTELNVQAVYSKLKGSLQGTISAQTLQPRVYPIDWTHNPICQGKPLDGLQNKESVEASEQDETGLATDLFETLQITPDAAHSPPLHPILTPSSSASTSGVPRSSFDCLVQGAPYDYVLLTDCVFSAELAVPLVNTILCCCGPRTTVLCCHEIRDEDANAAFIREFTKHFVLKRIPRNKLHEDYSNDMIEIISAKPIRTKKGDK